MDGWIVGWLDGWLDGWLSSPKASWSRVKSYRSQVELDSLTHLVIQRSLLSVLGIRHLYWVSVCGVSVCRRAQLCVFISIMSLIESQLDIDNDIYGETIDSVCLPRLGIYYINLCIFKVHSYIFYLHASLYSVYNRD